MRIASLGRWAFFGLVALWLLASLGANLVAPFDPDAIVGPPWGGPIWTGSNAAGPGMYLGTDQLGRDLLSRLLYGTRNTILLTVAATLATFVLGIAWGFWAAIAGGKMDMALSRVADLIIAIPALILVLLVVTATGPSIPVLIIVIAIVEGARVQRLARLLGMNVTAMEYFEVARMRGEKLPWLMLEEILPNARNPLMAEFGMRFCFIFLFVASLSFLGLGLQPPLPDLGSMVRDNAAAISFGVLAPLWPAGIIGVLAVAANLSIDVFFQRKR